MPNRLSCWCGNTHLLPFSDDYSLCPACHTLIFNGEMDRSLATIEDDEHDFYGKEYWLKNMAQKSEPDIMARSRQDLPERDLYWLRTLLSYKLPPARVLEIGSSHGGFVALMRQAGFEATGLELSPWIVQYAQETFQIPVLLGSIEQQKIEPGSLDVIVLMDVLEHLADPLGTLQVCARLLKPDGFFLIQTPCLPENAIYKEMVERTDPFLTMLLPFEHLYLFSKNSVAKCFDQSGVASLQFEPALFKAYDMFFVASRRPMERLPWQKVVETLESSPQGRLALALLDLYQANTELNSLFFQADQDRQGRLEIIQRQEKCLDEVREIVQQQGRDLEGLRGNLKDEKAKIKALAIRLQLLQSHWIYRGIRRVYKTFNITSPYFPAVNILEKINADELGESQLKRIAIDLTPVLPGGSNGGAKWMALELIRQLSQTVAPQWHYVLLTADDSHEELAYLDRENVERVCLLNRHPVEAAPATPPVRTGIHAVIHLVAKTLETLLPRRLYVRIYDGFHSLKPVGTANSVLKNLSIDLLYCPFTAPFYYDPHIPIIIEVHDLQWAYYPQFFSIEDVIHTRNYFNRSCQVANRLICISEFTRKTVLEKGRVESDQVVTIPHALFSTRKRLDQAEADRILEQFALPSDGYLYYPANFWPHKNHAMLLVAFNMFVRENPEQPVKLVFSGAPGSQMEELKQSASQMGLEDRVLFVGFVSNEEFTALLQSCMGVIYPSFFEGFGLPVLEAMSFCKPVLCSNSTSLPEVGGEAVLYFDPRLPESIKDALVKFTADPIYRKELAFKGLTQANKFLHVEDWARQYTQVFSDVLEKHQPRQYAIQGIYDDGWLGEKLSVYFQEEATDRQLELELEVPAWFPKTALSIEMSENDSDQVIHKEAIVRGKKKMLKFILPAAGGSRDFLFYPTAQPQALSLGADTRALSCRCLSCRILTKKETISLYEGVSTL